MSFAAGVVVELISTVLQNVGLNLQKVAHHRAFRDEQQREVYKDTRRTPAYCVNRRWWAAIFVFLVGVVLDFVALAFIPCTVSLPVGSLGLCVSAVCARVWLHERFKLLEVLGTCCVIAGSLFVLVFSAQDLALLTVDRVVEMFRKTKPLAFFCVCAAAWAVEIPLSYCFRNAVSYALAPGLTGVFTVLLGGIIGQLVLNTLRGNMQMDTYQFWLLVLALIAAILILNNYLQRALGAYDNMIVTPIYFTTVLVISVLSGIFFFGYLDELSVGKAAAFGVGIALIVVGCFLLSIKHIGQNQIDFQKHVIPRPDFANIEVVQTINLPEELNAPAAG